MAAGILANPRGRMVGTTGIKAGTPGSGDGCGCCCDCPAGTDADGCKTNTTPTNWTLTDSGITSPCVAACLAITTAPLFRDFVVDSGLGATLCLTGPGAGPWSVSAASGTETVYTDAACTILTQTNVFDGHWTLYRIAGQWRLILIFGPDPDGVNFVVFDGTIATTDPVDCCKPLTFTNSIVACGSNTTDPLYGFDGALLVGVGGTVVVTPCCS